MNERLDNLFKFAYLVSADERWDDHIDRDQLADAIKKELDLENRQE